MGMRKTLLLLALSPLPTSAADLHDCFIQVDSRYEKEDNDYRNLEARVPVKSLEECVKAGKRAAELKYELDQKGSERLGDLKNSYSKFIYRSGTIVFKGKYRIDHVAPP